MRLPALSLILWCCAAPAQAAPLIVWPSCTPLIAQLGHADFRQREAASRELARLGVVSLPAVTAGRTHPDPEVRRRCGDLTQLLLRRMELAQILTPTMVQLPAGERNLNEVVADFARQAGTPVGLDTQVPDLANRRVTLTPQTQSYWQTLDRLCAQAGLVPSQPKPSLTADEMLQQQLLVQPGQPGVPGAPLFLRPVSRSIMPDLRLGTGLLLTSGTPTQVPVHYAGSFRLTATLPSTQVRATTNRGIIEGVQRQGRTPAQPATTPNVAGLLLTAEIEPHMAVLQITEVQVHRAIDATGNAVEAHPVLRTTGLTAASAIQLLSGQAQTPLWLKTAPDAGPLQELNGTLTARVRKPMADYVTIDNVLNSGGASAVQQDLTSLQVDDLTLLANGDYRLTVRVAHPVDLQPEGMDLNDQRRQTILGRAGGQVVVTRSGTVSGGQSFLGLQLRDAQGQPYRYLGVTTHTHNINPTRAQAHQHTAQVLFRATKPDQGPPQKLVLRAAGATVVDVPFSFRDVPLR